MNATELLRNYTSLPVEAQKEVADFVAFLKSRYASLQVSENPAKNALADEPFIGMWSDREDLGNSSDWVRKLRDSEWKS